jgi:hypothetical protein
MKWTIALLACFVIGRDDPAHRVTSEELVEGYRENVARFPRLRVAYKVRETRLPAWRKSKEEHARYLEAEATKVGVDAPTKAQLTEFAAETRDTSLVPDELGSVFDFWTDRQRFQHRSAIEAPDWIPSDEPITPESLSTTYRLIQIVSYVPSSSHSTRTWSGLPRQGRGQGVVTKGLPGDRAGIQFPPLLIPDETWALRDWHPIDEFFRDPGTIDIVDDTGLDGPAGIIVAEIRSQQPAPEYLNAPKSLRRLEVIKAWIATKKGWVSTRIERSFGWFAGDTLVGGSTCAAHSILEVSAIEPIGKGFYPTKLTTKRFLDDPNEHLEVLDADQILAGDFLKIKTVLAEEMAWEALRVEPDQPMTEEMFALVFPYGTLYFDELQAKGGIIGMSDAQVQEMQRELSANGPPIEPTPPVAPSAPPVLHIGFWRFLLGVALGIFALAVLAEMILRRRRRRGTV